MPYAIVQPPVSLNFQEMSKAQLREYFAWFVRVLPERVAELEAAVQEAGRDG